jgi:DNA recombination protein RmuC
MNPDTLILLFVITLGFLGLGILFLRKKTQDQDKGTLEWLRSMQLSLENTNRSLQETIRGSTAETNRVLSTNTKALNERLDTAARVIGDLKKNLGEMSEVGRGIKSLQEFLQSPKLRGNIGEQVLADMIGQTFPRSAFHLQYQFASGVKVDAALLTDGGILPIDAKFPMENFRKMHTAEIEAERRVAKKDFVGDIKKHIHDIGKKYILPEDGTLDFALMYIPSEAVYYEVAGLEELMDFARSQRVYPVSPNTLYAHLQVLLLSFQGKEMEQKSKEVLLLLRAIANDYVKVEEQFGVLGKHITNAYNGMNSTAGSFAQLGQKLNKTKMLERKS